METPSLPDHRVRGGIFITRGLQVGIPVGGFSISVGPGGAITSQLSLQVALDTCPYWLEIAVALAFESERRYETTLAAWRGVDEQFLAKALEEEFTTCMQGLIACAIALDAFYAAIKPHIDIPEPVVQAWRDNRTARYRQIVEVLRRAFRIGRRSCTAIRQLVKEVYQLRDRAVHPPMEFSQPILHPQLQLGMEWRFVVFRFENARNATAGVLSVIYQLTDKARDIPEVVERCRVIRERLTPLVAAWEAHFGAVYERPSAPGQAV